MSDTRVEPGIRWVVMADAKGDESWVSDGRQPAR